MSNSTKKIIILISLSSFFASVEQAQHPRLRRKAVTVIDSAKRSIVSLSAEARSAGLKKDMSLDLARRILPQATFLMGDISLYERYSEKFFQSLYRWSDTVEPLSLDQAYVEIEYTSWPSLLRQVKTRQQSIAKELEIQVRVAGATNKITAYLASRQKSRAPMMIKPGEERVLINKLDISALPGIGLRSRQVLSRLGINTLRQLALAPDNFLMAEFGTAGLRLKQLARGIDNRPVRSIHDTTSITRTSNTIKPTRSIYTLTFLASQISSAITRTLAEQSRQGHRLTLQLIHDHSITQRSIKLDRPLHERSAIHEQVLKLLIKQSIENQPIKKLRLTVNDLSTRTTSRYFFSNTIASLQNIQNSLAQLYHRYGWRSYAI